MRGHVWERLLDTAIPDHDQKSFEGGQPYALAGRSLVVLATRTPAEKGQPVTTSQVKAIVAEARFGSEKPPGRSPI